jgi:ribose 5-phosphate isomerase B
MMRIGIGCDNLAIDLKNRIKHFLEHETNRDIKVLDFGVDNSDPVDYPDIAEKVALEVARGKCERGILICGTGIGVAIAANKVPGIRAAQVYDIYSAERSMKSNNAQIITLGALVTGPSLAVKLVEAWLQSEFQGGRSAPKVDKIMAIEERHRSS